MVGTEDKREYFLQVSEPLSRGGLSVHLAYLDESTKPGPIAIFGAFVVPQGKWGWTERLHGIAMAFRGIDERKRFSAIQVLLMSLLHYDLPFIYGAVDEKKLEGSSFSKSLFGTARAVTAAFRLCVLGVEDWAQTQHCEPSRGISVDYKDNYLLIVDNTTDVELKKQLQFAYRVLRANHPYSNPTPPDNRLWHSHDEMYFGDTVSCLGIQLADLCTYFMQRHLLKRDKGQKDAADEFFNLIAPHAICAKPQPEWTEHREFVVCHDESS